MGKPINFQDAAKRKDRKRLKQLMDDLLECIYHIVELDPWELLDAGDPVAYIPQSQEQMIFFSCVQEAENSLGIMVSPPPRTMLGWPWKKGPPTARSCAITWNSAASPST